MLNVYDIIINLLDEDRVYEFFEWSNQDNLEHIKKIPMVKVTSHFLEAMIYHIVEIESSFLDDIYKKTEVYHKDKIGVIDYAALFTDGYKVLAVEFNQEGKSLFKSFLLLDEEEEILDISNEIKIRNIEYKIVKKNNKKQTFLTREEENRKKYLIKELKNSYRKNEYEKINYLYEEIYPKDSKLIDDKYKILIADIDHNYSFKHEKLYNIIRLTHTKKTTSN